MLNLFFYLLVGWSAKAMLLKTFDLSHSGNYCCSIFPLLLLNNESLINITVDMYRAKKINIKHYENILVEKVQILLNINNSNENNYLS
jgi:hypothetical protein